MERNLILTELDVVKEAVQSFLERVGRRILIELLLLICILLGVGMIAASQWSATIITGRGNLRVEGVGVYHDADCSFSVTFLDWGTVEPDSTKDISLYVRNEGNYVASLFLMTNDWDPVNASDYMSLSWDYDGRTLGPMESIGVTLALSVSADAKNIDSFSFKVILGTSEVVL
jgi:hypothetical protein